jgi:hypothetical protein
MAALATCLPGLAMNGWSFIHQEAATMSAAFAPLPALPLCNFAYVLDIYRLLPDDTRARVPLRDALPWLPPPLPDPDTRSYYDSPASPFGDPDESQTLVGYLLLALLVTSERRQHQHHRANGGRRARRLPRYQIRPWAHDANFLRTEGALSLRLTFAHDLKWAVKLGLAARRARRAQDVDQEARCHAAFASALACLHQVMREMSGRRGGGWWMREQLKRVLLEVWLEQFGKGVWLPPDVLQLLRPAIHSEKDAELAALLLLEEALRHQEPPPLLLAPDDFADHPPDDDGDAGGTPALLV